MVSVSFNKKKVSALKKKTKKQMEFYSFWKDKQQIGLTPFPSIVDYNIIYLCTLYSCMFIEKIDN